MSSIENPAKKRKMNRDSMDSTCDFSLIAGIDRKKFSVHKFVMMKSCNIFNKDDDGKEFIVENVDAETLQRIITFCYKGQIEVTNDNIENVIRGALQIDSKNLVRECEQIWLQNLRLENCVTLFLASLNYRLTELRPNAAKMIETELKHLRFDEIEKIDRRALHELWKCDTEKILFETLTKKMDDAAIDDSKIATHLFKHIKFGLFSVQYLNEVITPKLKKFNCLDLLIEEYSRRVVQPNAIQSVSSRPIFFTIRVRAYTYNDKGKTRTNIIYSSKNELWTAMDAEPLMPATIGNKWQDALRAEPGIYAWENQKQFPICRKVDPDKKTDPSEGYSIINLGHYVYVFNNNVLIKGQNEPPASSESGKRYDREQKLATGIPPMPRPRYHFQVILAANASIYVVGGYTIKNGNIGWTTSMDRFDPISNSWKQMTDLNQVKHCLKLIQLNGFIYAFGKDVNENTFVESYHLNKNQWEKAFQIEMEPGDELCDVHTVPGISDGIFFITKLGFIGKINITNGSIVPLPRPTNEKKFSYFMFC